MHVAQVPESPATSSHLPSCSPEPRALPRPGWGRTGQQARQTTPRGGGPQLQDWGSPSAQPCGSERAPLTSWVWRAAAARRGRGDAAGFGTGWDMARPQRALPQEQRRLEGRPRRGAPRGRERRGRRARSEAAFPTQPRARLGAAPRPAGPSPSCPLLAVAVRA